MARLTGSHVMYFVCESAMESRLGSLAFVYPACFAFPCLAYIHYTQIFIASLLFCSLHSFPLSLDTLQEASCSIDVEYIILYITNQK